MSTPAALPPGARLLHIGPHKTGTTALQSAFHQAREDLLAQGVRYLSTGQHDARAARWVTDRMVAGRDPVKAERTWHRVVRDLVAPSTERRIFSSEFLSDATDAQIERIVGEVGATDLWVVVTMRPLARILSSQYQQSLQRGSTHAYDAWLRMMLADDVSAPEPAEFWRRHGNDELVRRWAEHVGPERVVTVVLDSRDHAFLPHTFEQLLGLRPETLAAKNAQENRSLTAAEAGLLRSFNDTFTGLGLDAAHYARIQRHLRPHLQARVPAPDEPALVTPDWAIEHANRVASGMANRIRSIGGPVHGDLAALSSTPTAGRAAAPTTPTAIGTDVAAWFAAGLALAAQRLATPAAAAPEPAAAVPPRGLRGRISRRG